MPAGRARAYTLVEVLVVVTVLGIAGALVVPAFSQTGVLRVQSAVRMVVSDIAESQSDALAYQQGRALVFYANQKEYKVAECVGATMDLERDLIEHRTFDADDFGGADFTRVDFGGANALYFDEMGSPVTGAGSGTPAPNGFVEITGSGQRYRLTVEAYTGRVSVAAVPVSTPPPEPGG